MATQAKTETQPVAPPQVAGGLLDEILAETKIKPTDEAYGIARKGVAAFVTEMLAPAHEAQRVDRAAVDAMIAELDKRLTAQVNEVLHNPDFQKLESAWRSLRYVVERVDFRENVRMEVLNLDKESLQADLDDAPDITKSGFYKIIYSNEYGVLGGKPIGVMNMNYDFGPGPQDIDLMRKLASIASM